MYTIIQTYAHFACSLNTVSSVKHSKEHFRRSQNDANK